MGVDGRNDRLAPQVGAGELREGIQCRIGVHGGLETYRRSSMLLPTMSESLDPWTLLNQTIPER